MKKRPTVFSCRLTWILPPLSHLLGQACDTKGRKGKREQRLRVGCPSKLVSIRNNRNWNRNKFQHYPKQNLCLGCFSSILKQRVSVFRLYRYKQKRNQNSLIESIFQYFCFGTVLFVSVVSIQVQNTETNGNKQNFFVFGFSKQTDLVSVRTEICLFVSRTPQLKATVTVKVGGGGGRRLWIQSRRHQKNGVPLHLLSLSALWKVNLALYLPGRGD